MEWLKHDDVPASELPEWATGGETLDGDPYRVRLLSEGIVLERGRKASALRWADILVPIHLDGSARFLLAAARHPPQPPWFDIGGADRDRIEAAVRGRLAALDERGYRGRRPARPTVAPEEILHAVLSYEAVAGAVEIPAKSGNVWRTAGVGGVLGSLTIGYYAMLIGGPVTGLVGGLVGLVGGAGITGSMEAARKSRIGRVLVLTPDGFVAGLDGGDTRAVPWSRVGQFREGMSLDGAPALEVLSPDGEVVARAAARFFGAPLSVIVPVAEAYRERAR
ncbi:MAG: hypothetical protein AB8I08_31185 [Sandaracinaceae bacterium]